MLNFSSGNISFGGGNSGEGKKTEYLIVGGLIAVIVATIGLALYVAFVRPSGPPPPSEVYYYCPLCKKEVIVKHDDLEKLHASVTPTPVGVPSMRGMVRPVCPICGKGAMFLERKCPKCGKYFAWDKDRNPSPIMDTSPIICPNCGTNVNQFNGMQPSAGPAPGSPGGPGGPPGHPGPGPGPGPGPRPGSTPG